MYARSFWWKQKFCGTIQTLTVRVTVEHTLIRHSLNTFEKSLRKTINFKQLNHSIFTPHKEKSTALWILKSILIPSQGIFSQCSIALTDGSYGTYRQKFWSKSKQIWLYQGYHFKLLRAPSTARGEIVQQFSQAQCFSSKINLKGIICKKKP